MPDEGLFAESYKAWEHFPENVVRHSTYKHVLKGYRSMLNERSGALFCAEGLADLSIWDYSIPDGGV